MQPTAVQLCKLFEVMYFRRNILVFRDDSMRPKALSWISKVEGRAMAGMYKDLRKSAICLIKILCEKRTERGMKTGNGEKLCNFKPLASER